ncbi:SDR family NAD(P)-dependent oxidoreductase [Spongiibacter sp. KMU-158]|uniref:SDR family NAD(P)-dependent oxidoreductase n=1 Tax=Spongiibacter pelagi TaxID=2760804 RepID=A0A927C1T2_9GAMM|nr:SDR family NAD(P)-dependent oxidoreductase [Spongiibacter pelagi]MBD2858231.1 SDR family NAD(P)-dependent oxidoreductase [Spongiibacter pelagi]
MKNFSNKVAAVTGAGSGIGRALALQLAKENCNLALADINAAGLEETCELLKSANVKVTSQTLDVSDKDAVYQWADQIVADHGAVHLIFNNAGVALAGTVSGLELDDYRWIMDINFWGTIYGTKAFLPKLEAAGEGHIINISSVFGLTAQPLMSGYNASKFAVRGFTESLRQDLALTDSVVSTTCVHPGGIKTNIARSSRMNSSVASATGSSDQASVKDFEAMFMTTPAQAANTILKGVKRNKRRVLIGPDARLFDWLVRCFPTGYQRLFTWSVKAKANKKKAKSPQAAN